jgi:protein-S-isoprenylcysteine O-methyltransferase Ste14
MMNGPNDNQQNAELDIPTLPPIIFGVPVFIGVLVHVFLWQYGVLGGVFGVVIGAVLVTTGVGLIFWGWKTLAAHGEHPEPDQPTKTLVMTGPFRRTRNPFYVSFLLIGIGIAVAVNSLAMFIAVFVGAAALNVLVVRAEEAYLGRIFGDLYTDYVDRTRRWF